MIPACLLPTRCSGLIVRRAVVQRQSISSPFEALSTAKRAFSYSGCRPQTCTSLKTSLQRKHLLACRATSTELHGRTARPQVSVKPLFYSHALFHLRSHASRQIMLRSSPYGICPVVTMLFAITILTMFPMHVLIFCASGLLRIRQQFCQRLQRPCQALAQELQNTCKSKLLS